MIRSASGKFRHMKSITASFLICMVLALTTASGAVTTGRASGLSVAAHGLVQMIICADGQGPKTILVGRDGVPVELPHPCQMLCDDCLQAGTTAVLSPVFRHDLPAQPTTSRFVRIASLIPSSTVLCHRCRAPPVRSANA